MNQKDYYRIYREELNKLIEAKSEEEIKEIGNRLEELLAAIRIKVTAPYLDSHPEC